MSIRYLEELFDSRARKGTEIFKTVGVQFHDDKNIYLYHCFFEVKVGDLVVCPDSFKDTKHNIGVVASITPGLVDFSIDKSMDRYVNGWVRSVVDLEKFNWIMNKINEVQKMAEILDTQAEKASQGDIVDRLNAFAKLFNNAHWKEVNGLYNEIQGVKAIINS